MYAAAALSASSAASVRYQAGRRYQPLFYKFGKFFSCYKRFISRMVFGNVHRPSEILGYIFVVNDRKHNYLVSGSCTSMDIRIVLVEPKFEGNVGAVARSMANFDLNELYLVEPCEIGDDAYRRSKHGSHILKDAKIVRTLKEALEGCFLVVGTSGIVTKGENNYVRIPITAEEFSERIKNYDEKVAILFGREDIGLLQDELAQCDLLITVPTSETYPVLNLSHAATIVMYEVSQCASFGPTPAEPDEKERLFSFFDELLDSVDYPEHRKETTSVMFRRLMGRAVPTRWEYATILGVFGDASKIIRKNDRGEHD